MVHRWVQVHCGRGLLCHASWLQLQKCVEVTHVFRSYPGATDPHITVPPHEEDSSSTKHTHVTIDSFNNPGKQL